MPLPETGGPTALSIKGAVSDEDSREALRGYLACVTFMDEQLSLVRDALESIGAIDNTVIVLLEPVQKQIRCELISSVGNCVFPADGNSGLRINANHGLILGKVLRLLFQISTE